jgi:hypothetical protein
MPGNNLSILGSHWEIENIYRGYKEWKLIQLPALSSGWRRQGVHVSRYIPLMTLLAR